MTDQKIITHLSHDEFRNAIADAIVEALKRTAHDDDFSKKFWQRGFVELSAHTSNASSQWIGRKILVAAATAALGWLLVYLVKSGGIK